MIRLTSSLGCALALCVAAPTASGAVAWIEGRLEMPGLLPENEPVQNRTVRGWFDPYYGYSYSESYPGPEASGPGFHTLMTRPSATTMTSRCEHTRSWAYGSQSVGAFTHGAMLPGETQSVALSLTDLGMEEPLYGQHGQTEIITDLVFSSFHVGGTERYYDRWAGLTYKWTRPSSDFGTPFTESVSVRNDFGGWNTAALEAQLTSALIGGHLDAPVTFPTFWFTLDPNATSGGWELWTSTSMAPSPGVVTLGPLAMLLAGARRPRRA